MLKLNDVVLTYIVDVAGMLFTFSFYCLGFFFFYPLLCFCLCVILIIDNNYSCTLLAFFF